MLLSVTQLGDMKTCAGTKRVRCGQVKREPSPAQRQVQTKREVSPSLRQLNSWAHSALEQVPTHALCFPD